MQISILPLGPLETNCYVAADEQAKVCVVIDPGASGGQIAQTLGQMGLKCERIALTHCHYDHVGGVKALHEATGAPVSVPKADLALPESITAGPIFYTDTYEDGDSFTVGGMTFEVLSTPGHTPGSCCLKCGDVLFTGDTLFQGSCGRTDMAGGSLEEMYASLARLAKLEGDYRVLPGHGGDSSLDMERKYNFYMQEAARA